MRRSFLLGALAVVAGEAVAAVLVITSGVVDVAATASAGLQDRVLAYASTRSIAHHAKDQPNPLAGDPAALKAGLEHYRAMCVACHGGPGVHPEEFAAGLHPAAPDLASARVRSFSDGMLYRTIAQGIGSTGMPAFGPSHQPRDLWSIVAFVRRLPSLTPEEKAELGRAPPSEGHQDASVRPDQAAAPGPAAGRVHRVSISGFEFKPAAIDVRAGETIEWKNEDFVPHTATADDRSFDTGDIPAGEARRAVAVKPGRFPYFCRYHLAMKGTVTAR